MANRNFREMLEARWTEGKFVCVGLDSEFGKIPEAAHKHHYRDETDVVGNVCGFTKNLSTQDTIVAFNRAIVEATKDLVCAYKPNAAFYEAHGDEGIAALHRTIVDIHTIAPDVPVILDAKRADIGNTNNGYVQNIFGFLGVDAVTVNPYLGAEALKPFLDCKDKGVFVLCRTSNPGAGEFQNCDISGDVVPGGYMPFYKYVAYRVSREWNKNDNCGLVVGATVPSELREVRELVSDMPILIPGVGAQGGDVEATVNVGKDSRGRGMIVNSSRGIIFASSGPDFAEAARRETLKLHEAINHCLAPPCGICGSTMVRSLGIWKCLGCGAITDVFKE